MTLRMLIISEAEKEAAHKVAEFAARPENHYRPGPSVKPPGDDPRFVLRLGVANDFRCVFSFTESHGLYRHLSVSVPDPKAAPNPAVVVEIAHLFGFKGTLEDWDVALDRAHGAVVVLQKV